MKEIKAFIEGSEAALEELVHLYTKPLLHYCYSLLCNYYDAEDAVQITFIKVFQKRAEIRNPEAFPAFLYKTAYSTSIDIMRKRRLLLFPAEPERAAPGPDAALMSDETERALRSLNPTERGLLYNRIVEEMSYAELSVIYGKSEPALRKRFARAKKKLAARLCEDTSHKAAQCVKEELK